MLVRDSCIRCKGTAYDINWSRTGRMLYLFEQARRVGRYDECWLP